ncbi:CPCC family cysteine-rich protein [Agaribacterium sp. ZY112]|uniref:CPCC family cysteine-rich protein n=1 Tax=Agaribacterium sp. ZY112 TaxID=3233574 RepID=UPI0035239C8E
MSDKVVSIFKYKKNSWYEPEDSEPQELCPCCDFISLSTRGAYEICPVCYWEDDGQDIDELDHISANNHGISLRQARCNFRSFGSSAAPLKKYVLSKAERQNFTQRRRDI